MRHTPNCGKARSGLCPNQKSRTRSLFSSGDLHAVPFPGTSGSWILSRAAWTPTGTQRGTWVAGHGSHPCTIMPALSNHFCFLFCFVFFFAVLQRAFPFHILQISSFPNSSHARTDFLAWLGELQTHRWRNESDTVQFLKPWSMGRFSQQQVKQLQQEFLVYRLSVFNDVQKFSKVLKLTCELRHGILGIHQGEGWMG